MARTKTYDPEKRCGHTKYSFRAGHQQCSYERVEGSSRCTIHDPAKAEARRQKSNRTYEAGYALNSAEGRLRTATNSVVNSLLGCGQVLPEEIEALRKAKDGVEKAKAALAAAKAGKPGEKA